MTDNFATVAHSAMIDKLERGELSIFAFGVTIGQWFSWKNLPLADFDKEIDDLAERRPQLAKTIREAVHLYAKGMAPIEAVERACGYYDETTGKPFRDAHSSAIGTK